MNAHPIQKEHKIYNFINTPLKRIGIFTLVTMLALGSAISVMAANATATVIDDGQSISVALSGGSDTDAILAKAAITVKSNDAVLRDDSNGVVITINRALIASVEADGTTKSVNAHYGDGVLNVITEAGVPLNDNDHLNVDKNSTLTDASTDLIVKRVYNVNVTDGGTTTPLGMEEGTVISGLAAAGYQVADADTLNVGKTDLVTDGMDITINRAVYATETVTEEIPFNTINKDSDTLYKGETKIETPGVKGTKTAIKECAFVNGELTDSKEISVLSQTDPVDEVKLVGTKAKPAAPAPSDTSDHPAAGGVPAYRSLLTGSCTGYTGGGRTASGLPAGVGRVSVDPRKIPYGTKLYIASADGSYVYGYAVAADTGGALQSGQALVDLYFNTNAECTSFGRRTLNVYILS